MEGFRNMDIKTIFFDLDDTLHDHQKPFKDAFKSIFPDSIEKHFIGSIYKKFRERSDVLWEFYTKGEMTLEELRNQRIIQAMEYFNMNITCEKATQFQFMYQNCLSNLELFPRVPELLETLKEIGFQIGIITNGPVEHQLNKISALSLTKHIPVERIFVSDAIGVAKPNPEIFQYVAKKIMKTPEELLYIGDSWNNDVDCPYQAGWQSVWYNHRKRNPESDTQPLAVIDSLMSLVQVLK
jgi:HAD superfamily hydrolase (TIGR01549 family)